MTDLELWQELKQGSKAALESIYSEHAAALLKYGRKFSSDEQLVEDCVQDLFIEIWNNRQGQSQTDAIRKYLLVALRRKIIKVISKQSKHIASEEPQEYQFEAELSIDQQLIATEISGEQHKQLQEALNTLSSRQREIIYLKYFNGIDNKGISEILDINYQSVRNLLSRTIKSLKDNFGLWWGLILIFLE